MDSIKTHYATPKNMEYAQTSREYTDMQNNV